MRYIARKIEHNILKNIAVCDETGEGVFITIGSEILIHFVVTKVLSYVSNTVPYVGYGRYARNSIPGVDSKCSFVRNVLSPDTHARMRSFA